MSLSLHQRQMRTDTERGLARGVAYPFTPAVVHDNAQVGAMASPRRCAVISSLVKLGGAVKSPVLFTRIPDRRAAPSTAAAVSRVRGSSSCASGTKSYGARLRPRSIIRATGLPSDTAHTAPVKPFQQAVADRVTVHLCVLSNALVPDGSHHAGSFVGNVRKAFGEFRNA